MTAGAVHKLAIRYTLAVVLITAAVPSLAQVNGGYDLLTAPPVRGSGLEVCPDGEVTIAGETFRGYLRGKPGHEKWLAWSVPAGYSRLEIYCGTADNCVKPPADIRFKVILSGQTVADVSYKPGSLAYRVTADLKGLPGELELATSHTCGYFAQPQLTKIVQPFSDTFTQNIFIPARDIREGTDQRLRVAVLPFSMEGSDWGNEITNAAFVETVSAISRRGSFRLFERDKIHKILEEQGLQAGGGIDPDTAVRIGELAGVPYVVLGDVVGGGCQDHSISDSKGKVLEWRSAFLKIHYRVVDVESGELHFSGTFEAGKTDYLGTPSCRSMMLKLAAKCAQKLANAFVPNLQGQVLKVMPDKKTVLIDLGKYHGVGQECQVRIQRLVTEPGIPERYEFVATGIVVSSTLNDYTCEVRLGQWRREKGGFLGLERFDRFKEQPELLQTVIPGDSVVLEPRSH